MTPQAHAEMVSALCSLGSRAHIMTGFLRQWLIAHFSKESQIEAPELRGKLWKAIPAETNLEIESITRWKPSTTEFRPGIIITRNDWKILRLGIDNRMMGDTWDGHGIEHFACYIEGSHTLFCLSSEGTEAEILAGEVYREMMQFSPAIRNELDLKRFALVGVGKLFELEEARENYAVPVTVAYSAEERWQLLPHAPFLKRIVLSTYLP